MLRVPIIITFYISAILLANFIALYIGQKGLIITAFLLIPFDFVIRSYFHETWKGKKLFRNLFCLIVTGGLLTYLINKDALLIAVGSSLGFILAGLFASIFYQIMIKKKYLLKVNGSDLIAIITDSFIFQYIAFNDISFFIMSSQIVIKFSGGLLWYWLLFNKFKIQKTWEE